MIDWPQTTSTTLLIALFLKMAGAQPCHLVRNKVLKRNRKRKKKYIYAYIVATCNSVCNLAKDITRVDIS